MTEKRRGRGRPSHAELGLKNPRIVRIPSGKVSQEVFSYVKACGTKIMEDVVRRSKGFRDWVAAGKPDKWPPE